MLVSKHQPMLSCVLLRSAGVGRSKNKEAAMNYSSLLRTTRLTIFLAIGTGSFASCTSRTPEAAASKGPIICDAGNGGITLPGGFCASVFADNLGHARHLVVAPNGNVYVNS